MRVCVCVFMSSYRFVELKEGRREEEGTKEGKKERRSERRKEGKKERRKEGRKKGKERKANCVLTSLCKLFRSGIGSEEEEGHNFRVDFP